MNTGERIKLARKAAGLTQTELAEKLGLKFSVISKYETGRVVNLKREVIEEIAKALHVRPSWLMCLDDKDPAASGDGLEEKRKSHYSDKQQKLIDLLPEMTDSEISVLLATAQAQIDSHKHTDAG